MSQISVDIYGGKPGSGSTGVYDYRIYDPYKNLVRQSGVNGTGMIDFISVRE